MPDDTLPGAPAERDPDTAETIDAAREVRNLRQREAAARLPGLAGFALIVASGPQRGLHWRLGEGIVEAGRNSEAGILLDDVTVSRHHASFAVTDGVLVVRDLGSTNGTYVNGRRVDEARLDPGDEVIVGRFHLVVARGE